MYVLVGTTQKSAVLRAADSAVDLAVLGVDVAPTSHQEFARFATTSLVKLSLSLDTHFKESFPKG